MTRLERARALANEPAAFRAQPDDVREFISGECEQTTDCCHCLELAASLALDGCPAPRARRKLPACTPVFTKGMPF